MTFFTFLFPTPLKLLSTSASSPLLSLHLHGVTPPLWCVPVREGPRRLLKALNLSLVCFCSLRVHVNHSLVLCSCTCGSNNIDRMDFVSVEAKR